MKRQMHPVCPGKKWKLELPHESSIDHYPDYENINKYDALAANWIIKLLYRIIQQSVTNWKPNNNNNNALTSDAEE